MTSFVAFPDIHDHPEPIKKIRHVLNDVDVVLLPGDMTNGRIDNLHRALNIIEPANEQIMAVCGNMDTEQMNMMLSREGISLHRRHQMIDGIAVLGVGGALPFAGDYVFSEDELAGFLEDTLQGVSDDTPKVLVCHQPPYNTKVDKTRDGSHVGSKAVRDFIERVQPLAAFTGHIHEAQGIATIGETKIINPGPIPKTGQYAYAEIDDGQLITLEIRTAEKLDI
jgi:hypothetical protein